MKTLIDSDLFFAVDMRVGVVTAVEAFPEARTPAWKLEVDFGPLIGRRWTSAQVTNYSHGELLGRAVVGVVNLPPKRVAGFASRFLLLGSLEPDGTVQLLDPSPNAAPGAPIA